MYCSLLNIIPSVPEIVEEFRVKMEIKLTTPRTAALQTDAAGFQPPQLDDDADFDSMLVAHMDTFEQEQKPSNGPPQSPSAAYPSSQPTFTPCSTPPRHSAATPVSPIPFSFPSSQESPSNKKTNLSLPRSSSSQPGLAFTPLKGKFLFWETKRGRQKNKINLLHRYQQSINTSYSYACRPVACRPVTCCPVARRPVTCCPVACCPVACRPVTFCPVACRPVTFCPVACRPVTFCPVACRPRC
jgi:hypothetical protein